MAENKFEEWLATMMKGGQARPNRFECIINFNRTIPSTVLFRVLHLDKSILVVFAMSSSSYKI